jgi:hypothetical protein
MEILEAFGYCTICEDYSHPDRDSLNCISDVCTDEKMLAIDGTCLFIQYVDRDVIVEKQIILQV